MDPRVSIIIVNFNGWRDTIACLQSLEKIKSSHQTMVIDNASTNDSVERIRSAFPEIELIISSSNVGFSGGNNIGIKKALERGADFVWLLNNDTLVDPGSLTALLDVATSTPHVGAVGSVLYHMENREKVQAWGGGHVSMLRGMSWHYTKPTRLQKIHYLTAASMLVRSEVFNTVGLMDDDYFMYWEDTDFGFRVREAGYTLEVADKSVIFHRVSASTSRGSTNYYYLFNKSAVQFFRKHSPYPFISLGVGITDRLLRRIVRGEFRNSLSLVKGVIDGFKAS